MASAVVLTGLLPHMRSSGAIFAIGAEKISAAGNDRRTRLARTDGENRFSGSHKKCEGFHWPNRTLISSSSQSG